MEDITFCDPLDDEFFLNGPEAQKHARLLKRFRSDYDENRDDN